MTTKKRTKKYSPKPRTITPMHVFVASNEVQADAKARLIVASHMAAAISNLRNQTPTQQDLKVTHGAICSVLAIQEHGHAAEDKEKTNESMRAMVAAHEHLNKTGEWHLQPDQIDAIVHIIKTHVDFQINADAQTAMIVNSIYEKRFPKQFAQASYHSLKMTQQ